MSAPLQSMGDEKTTSSIRIGRMPGWWTRLRPWLQNIERTLGPIVLILGLAQTIKDAAAWRTLLSNVADLLFAKMPAWDGYEAWWIVAAGTLLSLHAYGVPARLLERIRKRHGSPDAQSTHLVTPTDEQQEPPLLDESGARPASKIIGLTPVESVSNELHVSWKATEEGLFLDVKNENPATTKTGISILLLDMQCWSEAKQVFYSVPEFDRSPSPRRLMMTGGDQELYFDQTQRWRFLFRAGSKGRARLAYLAPNSASHHIDFKAGIWRVKWRIAWKGGTTYDFERNIEWSAGKVPIVRFSSLPLDRTR